jgi:hypothetical protein
VRVRRSLTGLRHHTVGERARQMIRLLARWLPDRQIRVLGDTAYSCLELGVQASRCGVTLITPTRLDSVLHAPPPPEQRRRGGKPQVIGTRLPNAGNDPGRSSHQVATEPDRVVRPRPAHRRVVYGNRPVVSHWPPASAHPLGAHA